MMASRNTVLVALVALCALTAPLALALPYGCGTAPHSIPPLSAASKAQNPKLKQVQVIVRHGDRTRASAGVCWADDDATYDCQISELEGASENQDTSGVQDRMYNQIYIDDREYLAGNCGLGELTERGFEQHVGNGQRLRDAYVSSGFLPSTYSASTASDFWLQSDLSPRTEKSGQAIFNGLYNPAANTDTETQIVNWNVRDKALDYMGTNPTVCPGVGPEYQAALRSKALAAWGATVSAFARNLTAELGIPASSFSFPGLQDCMLTHICHGKALPTKLTQTVFNQVTADALKEIELVFGYGNVTQLTIGPFLKTVWARMQEAMDATSTEYKKFAIIAGHDLGPMMPLLLAYKVFPGKWVNYAAEIVLELYEVSDSHAVRFIYNGEVVTPPGCSAALCPMNEFQGLTETIIHTADVGCNTAETAAMSAVEIEELRASVVQDMRARFAM